MPLANDDLYAQSWNTNFGSNPFVDGPSEYAQDTEDAEHIRFTYLMITAHPSLDLQKIVRGAQWNRPLNQIKIMKIMQTNIHNKAAKMIRILKKPKKNQ